MIAWLEPLWWTHYYDEPVPDSIVAIASCTAGTQISAARRTRSGSLSCSTALP
jgi:hypothetical protein